MKRPATVSRFASALALVLSLALAACGGSSGAPTQTAPTSEPKVTRMSKATTDIPEDSILLFQDNEGGAKLIEDMTAGRACVSCTALYDQMGSLPDVTVTDEGQIIALYNYLAHARVSDNEGEYVTDCYHFISFELQDGTHVTYRFEDTNLVWGPTNYEVVDIEPLWSMVRDLQDAITGENANKAPQSMSPYGLSGVVTMADYMRERYTSYEAFDQGIQSEGNVPQSLRLFASGETVGYAYDAETITAFWNALSALRINLDEPVYTPYEDGYVSFSFDSGKELIVFSFSTSELAQFAKDELYPIQDPAAVDALVEELTSLVKDYKPAAGDELVLVEDGYYAWDANDDGSLDRIELTYVDNGDEAPSVIVMHIQGKGVDATGVLERTYQVQSLVGDVDAEGPYLLVTYDAGDYYSHDWQAQCIVRLAGSELAVTPLDA